MIFLQEEKNFTHSVIMEKRKKMVVTGVKEVESFDENIIICTTEMGEMTVKGNGLHISGFNKETGDFSLDGTVCAVAYTDDRKTGGSVFSRIFK